MRDIKFRGWHPENGWLHKDGVPLIEIGLAAFGTSVGKIGGEREMVWTQFTGLRDKNSRPIFEGDIVRWSQGVGHITMPVEYSEHTTGYFPFNRCMQIPTPEAEEVEIIGNIYENPDLLDKP
ncbi:MAG: YopX family protein [Pseudomonadota bacterium]